ncbi:MAG: FAD:protein FMN transferase [Chitinophagaceae bacterium]|nr:FAD:protein FMN transferase [Chitinophagaceae bacterium]
MRLIWILLWSYLLAHNILTGNNIQKIEIAGFAQGTTYHITYYAADSVVKKHQVDSILQVIDNSMSLYKPGSCINRFNQSATGIEIDSHFVNVINKSAEVWKQSGGVFDITVQPLVKAWGFGAENVKKYPGKRAVKKLLKCVGTGNLSLAGNFLSKTKPCVTVDVNGIAQGYSVDVIAGFLKKRHISSYIVEIGGEIITEGKKPDGSKMKIGVEAPGNYENEAPVIQKIITLENAAVTTSGSYRKFHESKGKKFSHTIDATTGFPIQNEMISVTVIAKDAMTADAYDNVLMALGVKKGLEFVEAREDMAAYFIYKTNEGKIADTASSRFAPLIIE